MSYYTNKANARTFTRTPTETDQSQARDTDLNVIVGKMLVNPGAYANSAQPIYNDWTQFPTDLRAMIEHARHLDALHTKLPEQLKQLTAEQLMSLTNDDLVRILTPPNTPTESETTK